MYAFLRSTVLASKGSLQPARLAARDLKTNPAKITSTLCGEMVYSLEEVRFAKEAVKSSIGRTFLMLPLLES